MTDAIIIWYLLAHYSALTAQVPASRIEHVFVSQGMTPPAIAISHVSTLRKQFIDATATHLCTSRVQVTVLAADFASLNTVLGLVRAALPRSRGSVNGISVDSILPDIEGPVFTDEAGLYIGSLDYVVTYTE